MTHCNFLNGYDGERQSQEWVEGWGPGMELFKVISPHRYCPLLTAGSLVSLPMKMNASPATQNASSWRALPHAMARYSSHTRMSKGEKAGQH